MTARPAGRIVALEGASAAGKTTVAGALGARGWRVVAEAYDRLDRSTDLAVPTPEDLLAVERRLLREEERRSREAVRRRDRGEPVVLDTATVGPATYSLGLAKRDARYAPAADAIVAAVRERLADGRLVVPDRVVYLVAAESVRRARGSGSPERHPAATATRHAAVGRSESRFWRAVGRRSAGAVRFVDGGGAPDRVLALVERALARPAPRLLRTALRGALATPSAARRRHR